MRLCATTLFLRMTMVVAVFCGVAVSNSAATASFTWDPSPDQASGKVLGYKFYYSTTSFTSLPADVLVNPAFTVVTVTTGTTVNLNDLVAGQTYFMAVTAFGSNNQQSVPSNILTFTATDPIPPPVVTQTGLTASFFWDPSPDAATGKVIGYKFYYSTLAFTSLPADVATNPAFTILTVTNGTSVTLSNLVNGQTYFMAVTAFGAMQESLPSNVLTYTAGLPTVTITSPVSSINVMESDLVTLTASASGPSAISKIEFYDGVSLLVAKTAAPYSFATTFAAGSHLITAKAIDVTGLSSISTPVTITSLPQNTINFEPQISIVSPVNNSAFALNFPVVFTATASDIDGTIAKVEFFEGSVLLATATTAPFTATISSLASGTHIITAKATDNLGATATGVITININANQPPTVALSSPTRNSNFFTTDNVTITATASDSDGVVAKVEFFDGALLLGSATASPFKITASFTAGSHTLSARATDGKGAVASSKAIPITVKANAAPVVALTGLTAGALLSQPVVLSAAASDSDGTISRVEFFANDTSLGIDTSAPFSVSLPIASGTYTFSAKAIDNNGGAAFSVPITAIVKPTPPVNLTVK